MDPDIGSGSDYERNRAWRQANRDKVSARNQRAYAKRSRLIAEYKDRPCFLCSEVYPDYIMEFHHLGEKSINISAKHGWSRLKEELESCAVVCANCHAMLDYQRQLAA